MNVFISKFDQKYNKIVKIVMKLPPEILAFKLSKRANLTSGEHLVVLTGMDYTNKSTLYGQAKKSLRKFKGDQIKSSEHRNAVKHEQKFRNSTGTKVFKFGGGEKLTSISSY